MAPEVKWKIGSIIRNIKRGVQTCKTGNYKLQGQREVSAVSMGEVGMAGRVRVQVGIALKAKGDRK